MQTVVLLITGRYVLVVLASREMPSQDVCQYLHNVINFEIFSSHLLTCLPPLLAPAPVKVKDMYRDPCVPSPCGPNSQCRVLSQQASCSCITGYQGSPPFCRPECTINSDCPSNLACINEKCRDPCPGACGIAAMCSVVTHTLICSCPADYTGNPFTECVRKPVVQDPSNKTVFNFNSIRKLPIFYCYCSYTKRPLSSVTLWWKCCL